MSAASPATGAAFGEVYSSDITVATTTDQDARDSVIGLQRLNLIGPDSDSVAAKPLHRILSIPMPKLEGNTRRRPLRFTELPVDVLKEIIKEVTMPPMP